MVLIDDGNLVVNISNVKLWLLTGVGGSFSLWLLSLLNKTMRDMTLGIFKSIKLKFIDPVLLVFDDMCKAPRRIREADEVSRENQVLIKETREVVSKEAGIRKMFYEHSVEIGFEFDSETLDNISTTYLYRSLLGAPERDSLNGDSYQIYLDSEQRSEYISHVQKCVDTRPPSPIIFHNLKLYDINREYIGIFNMKARPVHYKNGKPRCIYFGTLTPADSATCDKVGEVCHRIGYGSYFCSCENDH